MVENADPDRTGSKRPRLTHDAEAGGRGHGANPLIIHHKSGDRS
jgi:hypothetical protein